MSVYILLLDANKKEILKKLYFTLNLQSVLRDFMLEQNLFHKSGL